MQNFDAAQNLIISVIQFYLYVMQIIISFNTPILIKRILQKKYNFI